jgi:DNA-3-methyladenine glycosylase
VGAALTLDLAGGSVAAARRLVGWTLMVDGVGGVIVETEAYRADDPASHSHRGRTARNAAMYGPPGTFYVYLSYGIHWCINIVCRPPGIAEAVLIRALEPRFGIDRMIERRGLDDLRRLCRGPGSVGQALAAGSQLNGLPADLRAPDAPRRVVATTRIGISRAVERPWRFLDPESAYVSRRLSSAVP